MASFSAGTTFTDGVANDVTAAKLAALVNAATPTSGLIQDRTAETSTAVNDTLLIGDASDSNNLKRMTVANFAGTLPTATITSGTITNLASTTGTIATLNSTTGTIATLNSTTGTIATLNSTTGTIATLNSTTGTIATLNSTTGTITTGVIPTLTSITKITSGTGTAAAPAISPTGDTNTGIFFPTADTVAFSEGGAESMRIDSSGNVGIGTTSAVYRLSLKQSGNTSLASVGIASINSANDTYIGMGYNATSDTCRILASYDTGGAYKPITFLTSDTERLRIDSSGNVGIGTNSPAGNLDVYNASNSLALVRGDSTTNLYVHRASTDISSPEINLRKSRGSIASPAAVATNDFIGGIRWLAFGGTTERGVTRIRSQVEAYVSDTDIASNLTFLTSPAGGVTPTEKLRIASAGQIGIGGANYGTSGQVLTSGGSAAAPSWTTISVTPGTSSITFPMLSTSATEADNAAKRVAKAWVNWNGTVATPTPLGSFNVSSITDVSTGKYTVNYTAAMSNLNYAVFYTGSESPGYDSRIFNNLLTKSTGGVTVYSMYTDASFRDVDLANVVVFT